MKAVFFMCWLCVVTGPTTVRIIASRDYKNCGAQAATYQDSTLCFGRSAATTGGDVSTGVATPVGPAEAAKEGA